METSSVATGQTGRRRVGLVHAVYPAMAPIHAAFARQWPSALCTNVLDDALPEDLAFEGGVTPRIHSRILRLAQQAADGADAVLFTCTAFDPAIDAAKAQVAPRLWKPNEAMLEAALDIGRNIGFIATFQPAVQAMESALLGAAKARGIAAQVRTICVPAAMAAARAGDVALHNQLVAAAVPELADCDVLLLAQFSTSTALEAAQAVARQPVLSAPDQAVIALRDSFGSSNRPACHE